MRWRGTSQQRKNTCCRDPSGSAGIYTDGEQPIGNGLLSVSTKSCLPAEASFSNKKQGVYRLFEKLLIERERHPSWVSFALSSFPISFRFRVCLQSEPSGAFAPEGFYYGNGIRRSDAGAAAVRGDDLTVHAAGLLGAREHGGGQDPRDPVRPDGFRRDPAPENAEISINRFFI